MLILQNKSYQNRIVIYADEVRSSKLKGKKDKIIALTRL